MPPSFSSSTPRSELERTAWPELDPAQLDLLRTNGETRTVRSGEVLFDVGQPNYDFFFVEKGGIDILDRSDDHVVATIEALNFTGELGTIMAQGTFHAAVAVEDSQVIVVPQARLLDLVATVPEISDMVVSAFAARRRLLIEWGEGGLTIVGRENSPATVELLEFASRNRIAYRFVDADDSEAVATILDPCGIATAVAATRPVVVTGRSKALVGPNPRQLAAALGMALDVDTSETFDVIVVGAGPAGLATGVYAASEGLCTLIIDDVAIGGQAGTSSRIENYLGFATGISGAELAYQGEIQAVKFGARLLVPDRATTLHARDDGFELDLASGGKARARAVVLACGVRYRRLPLDRLADFEGAGVYYAATELEARFCRGTAAVIVGGGNSAGQAAMFLSRTATRTHLVVRGQGLAATMSNYLSSRIERDPDIVLHTDTQITELHGEHHLEAVTLHDSERGTDIRIDTGALFVMVGAAPNTDWLGHSVALDDHGFVLTGTESSPFATSTPGVFAVGDIRSGSVKRVASAVGEGSVVVSAVHQHLNGPT